MEENMTEKRVYRLPPCRAWDIERMESWLSDMAAEGLHLGNDGFFCGVAAFVKGEKKRVRYRLEPALKSTSPYADDGGEPAEEAVELNEQLGWEYAAKRDGFYIYRTEDADAPELNTDPQVQALALRKVRWRMVDSAVGSFLYLIVSPLLWVRGGVMLAMVSMGTVFILLGIALLLWGFADSVFSAIYFVRLRRRLLQEGDIDHHKPWRRGARRRMLARLALPLLALLWFAWLGNLWIENQSAESRLPLSDFAGDPPFVTMADLATQGEYAQENYGYSDTVNTYRCWGDVLAPVCIRWDELAQVALPDGTYIEGGFDVEYYEAASPWIADVLARDMLRVDKYGRNLWSLDDFEYIALPELGVDYAVAYRTLSHFPQLILRQGNRVVYIQFYQTSNTLTVPIEEWAQLMADAIK